MSSGRLITLPSLTLLLIALPGLPFSEAKSGHTLAGKIYFTNNTPPNYNTFPVELYTRNQKRRGATAGLKLSDIKNRSLTLEFW
jgi:hypothetical protein